ncbi:MAG: hypothetical protein OHK0021_13390 [Bryobacter sp.]
MRLPNDKPFPSSAAGEQAAAVILRCLEEGKSVEIPGFGSFVPQGEGRFEFIAHTAPRVFIAYAIEDAAAADAIFDALENAGMAPWMDRRCLQPGQNWPRIIESAIEATDFFLPCLSRNSVSKRGGFQSELRFALDVAQKQPLDHTYLVPVRLNDCRVPRRLSREWQYIDLFPDWEAGLAKIVKSLHQHTAEKLRRE